MIEQQSIGLEEFEISVKKSPRKTETYVIDDISEINDVIKKVVNNVGKEEVSSFMGLFKENIIKQLKMISTHKAGLSDDIISSISKPIIGWTGGKLKASLIIDHPLAIAINDGTGIYGPEHTPITPKSRKVMFIPRHKLKHYYLNKVKDLVKEKGMKTKVGSLKYESGYSKKYSTKYY
jgi:hypothetical protein